MSHRPRALLVLAAALLMSGCGAAQTPPPDTTSPAAPQGSSPRSFPSSGIAFSAPLNWTVTPGSAPEVAQVASAASSIAIFRYARQERLPRSRSDLDQAADRIVEAARARDGSYRESARERTEVDGQPAIQVDGTGSIVGRPVAMRSVHVYGRGGEVVVEAVASRADLPRVASTVVAPLLQSLQLTRPQA